MAVEKTRPDESTGNPSTETATADDAAERRLTTTPRQEGPGGFLEAPSIEPGVEADATDGGGHDDD